MAQPYVRQLLLGPMDNFVYLVGAPESSTCAVIDAAWDVDAIVAAAAKDGRSITHAFATHCHHDHINGLAPLLAKQGVRVVVNRLELAFSPELRALDSELKTVRGGEEVDVGGLLVRCLHTPGHTPGSQCFQVGDGLVTGDTLFIGACGRCDLEGGDPEAMFDSLQRLRKLDPATVIYPGHDYGNTPTATLASELKVNPYLKLAERDAFTALRGR